LAKSTRTGSRGSHEAGSGGFQATIGVFDPLEPLGQGLPASPESAPRAHGKIHAHRRPGASVRSVISQKHEGITDASDFDRFGFDVGGNLMFGGAEIMAGYYQGEGMGATASFLFGSDGAGSERGSDGYLAQVTYEFGDLSSASTAASATWIFRPERRLRFSLRSFAADLIPVMCIKQSVGYPSSPQSL
jgi:hypothetical protein